MSGDREKVLAKWPWAKARHWGGWRDGEQGWKIETRGALLGMGDTEDEAWAHAAKRIEESS